MNTDQDPIKIVQFSEKSDARLILEQIIAEKDHHLLLVSDRIQLPAGFLAGTISLFTKDPMIAFVNPLIIGNPSDVNQEHFSNHPIEYSYVPVAQLKCVMIRKSVVANFLTQLQEELLDAKLGTFFSKEYLGLSAYCNKYGYRSVIYNRTPIVVPYAESIAKTIDGELGNYPEIQWGLKDYHSSFEFKFTKLFIEIGAQLSSSLLIDIRDMPLKINGTSIIVIEFLKAILNQNTIQPNANKKSRFTILLRSDQVSFLTLQNIRLSDFEVITNIKNRYFTHALKLGQPWLFSTVRELSECALFNYYYFYDTIAADCYYLRKSDQHLNEIWSFISEYADGIFFISEFSRQQFICRYGEGSGDDSSGGNSGGIKKTVLLPLETNSKIKDIKTEEFKNSENYILIFGNHLHHKAVLETAVLIGQNISKLKGINKILLLGFKYQDPKLNIFGFESGNLSNDHLSNLYNGASCIVFPSHYEGFGLPIIEARLFNKKIFVRDLPVYKELEHAFPDLNKWVSRFNDNSELIDKLADYLSNALAFASTATTKGTVTEISPSTLSQRVSSKTEGELGNSTWANTVNSIVNEISSRAKGADFRLPLKRHKQLDFQKKFCLSSQELSEFSVTKLVYKKLRTFLKKIIKD